MSVSAKKQIEHIKRGNYGVRSGVYAAISESISVEMDEKGEYQYLYNDHIDGDTYAKLARVDMMSEFSKNEGQLSDQLFSKVESIRYDEVIGYYSYLGAGYVAEGNYRKNGSSGGMTSWILDQLLKADKIDFAIHAQAVNPDENNGVLFKYVASATSEGIQSGAKSKYYPLELSEVLRQIKERPGRYAIVGIPEFITELRLLAEEDETIKERIKYTVGLVCGHQKSARYAEALAWQHGIKPGDLKSVDFRVKKDGLAADDYLQQFTGIKNGKVVSLLKKHNELFADHWPMGFFKANFSDYSDNVFNEVADVVFGDAWLKEYNGDSMGNNIIIVRNPELYEVIQDGIARGGLKIDEVGVETVKRSQSGLIHHVRDELPYRLYRKKVRHQWFPKKRVKPSGSIHGLRKKVQVIRLKSAKASHEVFREAISRDDYKYFEDVMARYMKEYNHVYTLINSPKRKNFINAVRMKLKLRTRLRILRVRLRVRMRLVRLKTRMSMALTRKKFSKMDGVILTLSGYYNYGNILQRYALQKFLKKNGLNFVSYWNEQPHGRSETDKQLRYTKDFVKRNIICKQFDSKDNFLVYLVGSDQVWRNWGYEDAKRDLGYYFFNFLGERRVKRIAYAASIGQDSLEDALITKEVSEYIQPLIQKFDSVSIREHSGVELVKKSWGVDAKLVIDPTMLLLKEDYSKLIDVCPYPLTESKNSVFTYFILSNDSKRSFVESIIKREKLVENSIYLEEGGVLPPIEAWLKGIRDAKVVIADSFHGVVFSIIFNRPFLVIESGTGGSARITSLLSRLGLDDRYVISGMVNSYDIEKLYDIDWEEVNKKLEELRQDSGKWLINAISNNRGDMV